MTRTEELEQENAALRRENARLRKDKERLDWVEINIISIYMWFRKWIGTGASASGVIKDTVRKSIDAAIRHQKKEGKNV